MGGLIAPITWGSKCLKSQVYKQLFYDCLLEKENELVHKTSYRDVIKMKVLRPIPTQLFPGRQLCMYETTMYVCMYVYYLFVQLRKSGDYKYTKLLKILFCAVLNRAIWYKIFFRSFTYKSFCFRNTFESELL